MACLPLPPFSSLVLYQKLQIYLIATFTINYRLKGWRMTNSVVIAADDTRLITTPFSEFERLIRGIGGNFLAVNA
jgi:hypothetical protein